MATQSTRVLRSQATTSVSSMPVQTSTVQPSPQLETAEVEPSRMPLPHGEEMPSTTLVMPPKKGEMTVPEDTRAASTDAEDESSDDESDEHPRKSAKRAQSLDSAKRRLRNKKVVYLKSHTLSTEQEKAVEAANELLTEEQKEQIAQRQDKVANQLENVESGPSRNKGKTIDPREWGNARLNPEELDVNVQEAIFEAYKEGQKQAREIIDDFKKKVLPDNEESFRMPSLTRHKSIGPQNLVSQRAGSRPAAQIVPDSSLGVALGRLAQNNEGPDDSGPDDPDDSSSGCDSSYSRSTRSRSRSGSRRRRRRRSKRRSKRRSRHRGKGSRKSGTIKPIAPKDYDGEPNARAYHRFVMEGEAYLRDGKVTRERQIRILAHYLDGKAYDFYMQKVATDNPNNWTLHKFFTELFNYCFPLDYRQQMRLKLENSYQQSNQTVSEYVFELQEMFSMVGTMPIEMKVIKLWHSLKAKIQRAMWRDGLHPDTSTWDEVVAKAEMIELADSVVDPRDRNKPPARKQSNFRPNSNSSAVQRNTATNSASRSITYASRGRNNNWSHNNSQGNNQNRNNGTFQRRSESSRPFRGQSQNRNSTPQTGGSSKSNSPKKKSVQFAGLSEKDMAQLRAEGKCFICKEVGHISRNCPRRNNIPGNGSNKPPGIPSYSMDMTVIENDDSNEIINSLSVGFIDVRPEEEWSEVPEPIIDNSWRKGYPTWQDPRASAPCRIGNCYEKTAEYILTIQQPYPGDGYFNHRLNMYSPPNRFRVTQLRMDVFMIQDRLSEFEICIEKTRLENIKFNLGHWYAKWRALILGLSKPSKKDYPQQLENPLILVTQHVLRNGINDYYPNVKTGTWREDRFFVHQKDFGSPTYVIIDDDLELEAEIDKSKLENPDFDLVEWYVEYIKLNCHYYKKYLKYQRNRYNPGRYNEEILITGKINRLKGSAISRLREEITLRQIQEVLERCAPFPGDELHLQHPTDPSYIRNGESRFVTDVIDLIDHQLVYVYDRLQGFDTFLSWEISSWNKFSLGKWYAEKCALNNEEETPTDIAHEWVLTRRWDDTIIGEANETSMDDEPFDDGYDSDNDSGDDSAVITLNGVQVDRNKYESIQRNASRIKGAAERLPSQWSLSSRWTGVQQGHSWILGH